MRRPSGTGNWGLEGKGTTLRGWVPGGVPGRRQSREGGEKRKKEGGQGNEPCKDLVSMHRNVRWASGLASC